jgi:hypothetical protein
MPTVTCACDLDYYRLDAETIFAVYDKRVFAQGVGVFKLMSYSKVACFESAVCAVL